MPLVIFVDICPILGNVPLKDDIEYLARLVTDFTITGGNILRLHLYRNNLIGIIDWLKGDPLMSLLTTRGTS